MSAAGCAEWPDLYSRPLTTAAVHEVAGSLVSWDNARQRFTRVRPGAAANADALPWPHTLGEAVVSGDAVLAMAPSDRLLARLDASGDALKLQEWALPSDFSAVTPSVSGSHAALWHRDGGANASSLVNPSEVALVDLAAAAASGDGSAGAVSANPRVATVSGLSRAPIAAHVSPEIQAADGVHRVVWLDAPSRIGIADFGPGGVRTVVVPLTPPESTAVLTPARTVTRVEGGTLHLYLIASGSDDVVHLSIALGAGKPAVSIDQLAAGKGPSDLLLFEGKDGLRVAALSSTSRELWVLNPTTGAGTSVTLEHVATAFAPFVPGEGAAAEQHALLWNKGAAGHWLQLANLSQLEKKKGKAVDVLQAEHPVNDVVAAGGLFALRQLNNLSGVSMLDPVVGKITSFAGTGQVESLRVQEGHVFVHGRVNGTSRLSRIALADLHGTSVTVSPGATRMLALGTTGVALLGEGLAAWRYALFASGDLDDDPQWLESVALDGLLDAAGAEGGE